MSRQQPPAFLGGSQRLTRSLGGMSEFRKTLSMISSFFLRKALSLFDRVLLCATAPMESDRLENLQRHVGSCSETSADDCWARQLCSGLVWYFLARKSNPQGMEQ